MNVQHLPEKDKLENLIEILAFDPPVNCCFHLQRANASTMVNTVYSSDL